MSPKRPREGASLFAAAGMEQDAPHPLPDRLRPRALSDVVGQDHILGPDGALTRMLATRTLGSLIFWGPRGTGKTTVARLLVFHSLDPAAVEKLFANAEKIEGRKLPLDAEARAVLVRMADGDGRAALTLAEEVWRAVCEGETFNAQQLQDILQRRAPIYDKSADGHYNLISALHKSVRGSDPDAALYYLARMMDAGEDPLFLARRVVRMAVEDIGLADPQALVICNAAKDAYDFLGHPEGELAIAQAVIYIATAPKSNAAYKAFGAAMRVAKEGGSLLPPKHILNSPTKLMKSEGYGSGYEYDHDAPDAFSGQDYFPEALGRQTFYDPPDRGFEREIRKRLEYWAKLRRERGSI